MEISKVSLPTLTMSREVAGARNTVGRNDANVRAAVSPAERVIAEESDAPAAAFDTSVKCSEAVAATTAVRRRG